MISPRLRNWVVGVVTAVWATNFVASLIPQMAYKPDPAINAVFMAIVGGAFALSRESKNKEANQDEEDKDREGKPS